MTQTQLIELKGQRILFFMKDKEGISHKFEGKVETEEVIDRHNKENKVLVLKLTDVVKDNNFCRNIVFTNSLTNKLRDWRVIK